ncbi:hypothetical protein [Anaeromyxobacter oryzae]|nr:hypothetical protein [Anaeromyxobacter oryzae]
MIDRRGPGPIYSDSPAFQIEIELESGDVIEIEARNIVIAPAA